MAKDGVQCIEVLKAPTVVSLEPFLQYIDVGMLEGAKGEKGFNHTNKTMHSLGTLYKRNTKEVQTAIALLGPPRLLVQLHIITTLSQRASIVMVKVPPHPPLPPAEAGKNMNVSENITQCT